MIFVRLLGHFAISLDPEFRNHLHLTTKKAAAMVAYLALSPQHSATRAQLATLLWSNCNDRLARQNLRQTLVYLRKDLGDRDLIQTDAENISLHAESFYFDTDIFNQSPREASREQLEAMSSAIKGEFLTGFYLNEEPFEDWVRHQRSRFEGLVSEVYEALAAVYEAAGQGAKALAAAERLRALDPLREDWHRLILRLYARYRGQGEAFRQSRALAETLRNELDTEPEPATRALLEEIRRGDHPLVPKIPTIEQEFKQDQEEPPLIGTPPVAARHPTQNIANPLRAGVRLIRRHTALSAILLVLLIWTGVATVAIRAYSPTASPEPAAAERRQELGSLRNVLAPAVPARPRTDPSGTTIAVLPFVGLDENAASVQLVADILTDELINTLARAPQLRVISRQATSQYFRKPVDIAAIGTELGAQYVLEGTVRFSEQSLRVNVELVDAATRASVWSARIEPQAHDNRNVQDEIAKRLARELQIELYQVKRGEGQPEPSAHALVHKGYESLIGSAKGGLETLQSAERYFRQALAKDPMNRPAKRGVAAFHALVGAQLMTPDPASHLAQAEALLREAIRTDPKIGSAHFFLGLVQEMRRDYAQALESFDRAIEADPSYLSSYAHVGYVLVASGKAREGYERIAYALRTGPRDPNLAHWLRFAGEAKLELGEYDEALKVLEKSYELNPNNPLTLRSLAAAYGAVGKLDDARRLLAELRNLAPYLSDAGILKRPQTLHETQPEYARGLALAIVSGPLP